MPGIVPRALSELFSMRQKYEANGFTISFECYIVELYLDQLHDLLYDAETQKADKPKLELREDPHTGMIQINNVQQCPINTLDEAQQVYNYGV